MTCILNGSTKYSSCAPILHAICDLHTLKLKVIFSVDLDVRSGIVNRVTQTATFCDQGQVLRFIYSIDSDVLFPNFCSKCSLKRSSPTHQAPFSTTKLLSWAGNPNRCRQSSCKCARRAISVWPSSRVSASTRSVEFWQSPCRA